MNLHDILLKKAYSQELGHFYILETSAPEEIAKESLLKFAHAFIRDYYQKVEGHKQSLVHLMDHPDVYVLGSTSKKDEDEKESPFFNVEEAEAFSRFFEFRPVQGKRKFAVITEAHRMNNIIANKWLKLLEEPQGLSTIFLLNPRRQKLLETIHSRAIHLRLPFEKTLADDTTWKNFLKESKGLSLSQFLENYSKGEEGLAFWVGELIRWEADQLDQMSSKTALEKWLKSYQEMETFHQPTATKWTLFHGFLCEHVFKRGQA